MKKKRKIGNMLLFGSKWHERRTKYITPAIDRNAKARSKAEDLKLELELRRELEGY